MRNGFARIRELVRRNLSTFSRAHRLAVGPNLEAWHHTLHISSPGLGSSQTFFRDSRVLDVEQSSTNNEVHPGVNAFLISCSSDIFHCVRAYTTSSSQHPHRNGAVLVQLAGFVVFHRLRSHSRSTDGLHLALGQGRVLFCLRFWPFPVGVDCVGG